MYSTVYLFGVLVLTKIAAVLSTTSCVECGKDGSGCLAAKQTKGTAYTLSAQQYPGNAPGYLFSARVPDGNVLFSAQVFSDKHQFDFYIYGPTTSNSSSWPIPADQRTLWFMKTKTLSRYYYLTGYGGECVGLWNKDAFSSSTVITVYKY